MSIDEFLDILFTRTWWTYDPGTRDGYSTFYHWFNLCEGAAWLILAAVVFSRHLKHRHSPLELAYALAFATFGLSDFREAWVQSSPLLWFKLANLIALLWLRRIVMTRWYPESRVF
jgi:hypothetical protein